MNEENDKKRCTKNIKAFIQIIPNVKMCWEDVKILQDRKTLYIRRSQDFGKGVVNIHPNYWTFTTDGVLYNLNQTEIYNTVMPGVLDKAIMGNDVIIFSYGQTGTGKSSTINGLHTTYDNRGLCPRIISELFEIKEKHKCETKIKYSMSFVEVTRACVLDLLKKEGERKTYNPFKNIKTLEIKSEHAGFRVLFHGEGQRDTSPKSSYVSHMITSVVTIHIKNCSILKSNPTETYSKIHIIDMPGMDTDGNLSCQWKKSKEIGTANLAKSQLEQCLLALQESLKKHKSFVKDFGILVDYLGDSLKPQSIIRFIGHIRATRDDLHVTLSVLRFANTARCIKSVELKPYIVQSDKLVIENLRDELNYLVKQNHLNNMFMNEDLSTNITQARIEQMQNSVDKYMKNKSDEISFLNVTDIKTVMKLFKDMYNDLDSERLEALNILQQQRESLTSSKITNKASLARVQTSKDKARTPRGVFDTQSRQSTSTTKKRKSADKSSAKSTRTSIAEKASAVGYLSRSGVSLGQIMTQNYQGAVTKSRKRQSLSRRSKIIKGSDKLSRKSAQAIREESVDISRISDIYLQTSQNDYEAAWNTYIGNTQYNYAEFSENLKRSETLSREFLHQYNELIHNLEAAIALRDTKKNDLLKIHLYKDSTHLKCDSEDSSKIVETQQKLEIEIVELDNEVSKIKEQILTTQTELKIHIDEYHRVKICVDEEFKKFCIDTYKIPLPSPEQIECIEDKLMVTEFKSQSSLEIKENSDRDVFNKLQSEMKITQERLKEQKIKTLCGKNIQCVDNISKQKKI